MYQFDTRTGNEGLNGKHDGRKLSGNSFVTGFVPKILKLLLPKIFLSMALFDRIWRYEVIQGQGNFTPTGGPLVYNMNTSAQAGFTTLILSTNSTSPLISKTSYFQYKWANHIFFSCVLKLREKRMFQPDKWENNISTSVKHIQTH